MKILILAMMLQSSGNACMQMPYGPAIQGAGNGARSCVLFQAQRLRRSRERADLVADAAVTRCRPQFETLRARFEQCTSTAAAFRIVQRIRARLRADAEAAVVEARARR